ncbi:allophanate hydrolase [Nitriliruptor alkaliphilus]|uniref:allophanate hydrolase n=1 Tax=Nitriliruptor alkaliphilus TaxID=427918 RepID=UPI0006961722|nr:allophanate hydrolase [Nitriliruptor alkaliphilus]
MTTQVGATAPASRVAALGVRGLVTAYRGGRLRPSEVVTEVLDAVTAGDPAIWIDVVEREVLLTRCGELEQLPDGPDRLPLYGVPFAVKDNIDVAGRTTTAGCPAFATDASVSAPVVELLEAAGAILVGKTNLDQFATGLVGTRSPYGVPVNPSAPEHVPGGSSSGSAVAVASGLVAFSLGTDTAGSGRVPAAMNGIVGLKPTRGLLSTRGLVPACRSLDCVSVFAGDAADAAEVLAVLDVHDTQDELNLRPHERVLLRPDEVSALRIGVPTLDDVDPAILDAFEAQVAGLSALGATVVPIDLTSFEAAGRLLYDGPWLAERVAGVGDFVAARPGEVLEVTREVIAGGRAYSAVDLFRGMEELATLRRRAERVFERIDVIALPSVPTLTTLADVAADPIGSNARLGRFTNFVNLLDLAAIAVPAGAIEGVPVGVTLLAPALHDLTLVRVAARFLGNDIEPSNVVNPTALAVAGAHLRGQPLHHQLTVGGARLLARTTTAPTYRFYATDGPGLTVPALAPSTDGVPIDVEVYEIPGTYLQVLRDLAADPLTIRPITLADGSQVQGYRTATDDAPKGRDISRFGSWRAYLASDRSPTPHDPDTRVSVPR